MLCPGCGATVESSIVFCAQCGYSIARRSEPLRYAGFLPRAAAAVIDFVLMTPLILVLLFFLFPRVTPEDYAADVRVQQGADRSNAAWHRFLQQEMRILGALALSTFIASWPYYTLLESSPTQATIGKMIMRLKVTDLDGRRIRWGRANARYLGRWISGLPYCAGYLFPLFTARKQALHDLMSRCLVLKK
jgi:uncharacterized RDD family membrane protein YckC